MLVSGAALAQEQETVGPAPQERALGLVPTEPTAYEALPPFVPPTRDIPVRYELGPLPEVGDQGKQGSCVGWAVAYAAKTAMANHAVGSPVVDVGPFSPSYLYNQVRVGGCDAGSRISDTLDQLVLQGVLPIDDFPYDDNNCSRIPTAAEREKAGGFKSFSNFRILSGYGEVTDGELQDIKATIAADVPVILGIRVYDNFWKGWWNNHSIYKQVLGVYRGGHAVVAMGYDDNRNAMKIMNSWGREWGANGFAWIDYSTLQQLVVEAYAAEERKEQ